VLLNWKKKPKNVKDVGLEEEMKQERKSKDMKLSMLILQIQMNLVLKDVIILYVKVWMYFPNICFLFLY